MGFSRLEHWSGLSCPLTEDLPHPVTEPQVSCVSRIAGRFFTSEPLVEMLQIPPLNTQPANPRAAVKCPWEAELPKPGLMS